MNEPQPDEPIPFLTKEERDALVLEFQRLTVGGVEIVTMVPRTSEKVLDALRRHGTASLVQLGLAAYGSDPTGRSPAERNTRNKLTRLLDRMKNEGLIESPEPGMWRISA